MPQLPQSQARLLAFVCFLSSVQLGAYVALTMKLLKRKTADNQPPGAIFLLDGFGAETCD